MERTSSHPPVRCHCTIQFDFEDKPSRCPNRTAGPDSPFCLACEDRHSEHSGSKIGTVPPGEHPGDGWLVSAYNGAWKIEKVDTKIFRV